MTPEDIKKQDKYAALGGKHKAMIGGDPKYVMSYNHSGSWQPHGLEETIRSDNIHVNTSHNMTDGTIKFYIGVDVAKPARDTKSEFDTKTRYHLQHGTIYPDGSIDLMPKPEWSHTTSGSIDERAIKFILADHLGSKVRDPKTEKIITVAEHHGLKVPLKENWKKNLQEDLRRWFKEKWTAQDGSKCGEYKGRGRVKCRPSKRVSGKSPQTWSEMSPKEKKKAVRLKQKAHREGKQFSSHKSGKTWDGKKNKYRPGKVEEMLTKIGQMILERKLKKYKSKKDCGCGLQEEKEKKPYKGFKKGKNHPEGGLSRAEARRQGIHAGIETKREAQKKGGFGKLSGKTKKRRKSFCARMCGMKRRRTSAKTARDPKSKINAALRVWGCKCGTNESYEPTAEIIMEKNTPTDSALWSKAKALARKKFDVYPSAYANGWAAKWYKKHGGGWKSSKTESVERMERMSIVEEIVNWKHAGSMTDTEIAERDRIAKKIKNIKPIKGKDSVKNAKYRYATFLVLRKRKSEKQTKGKKKK